MTADAFIETYTDVVLREGDNFFEVLLRMAEDPEKPCIFLSAKDVGFMRIGPIPVGFFP